MLRDGLRTVAGLVVKSTWIIIPRIQSHNPASAFEITFISSQGHNSGKVCSGAIRAKVHELFRICDKYRWGNETRRNRTDIKMVFVLADKLPGRSEFCNSARPKPRELHIEMKTVEVSSRYLSDMLDEFDRYINVQCMPHFPLTLCLHLVCLRFNCFFSRIDILFPFFMPLIKESLPAHSTSFKVM